MQTRLILFAALFFAAQAVHSARASDTAEQQVRSSAQAYVDAFNKHDAAKVAARFVDDAVYIAADESMLTGRKAIENALIEQFKSGDPGTLEVKIASVQADSPDHAIERGVSTLTFRDQQLQTSYMAEHVKRNGAWQLKRIEEHPVPASYNHLVPLVWLLGNWEDAKDETVKTSAAWSLDRAFITRKFSVGVGEAQLYGIEYIGWDTTTQKIRSWYFDSDGGFGESIWVNDGNRWIQQATGTLPNGSKATATRIYTIKDKNSITFQAISREVDGEKLPDVPEVVITRKAVPPAGTVPPAGRKS